MKIILKDEGVISEAPSISPLESLDIVPEIPRSGKPFSCKCLDNEGVNPEGLLRFFLFIFVLCLCYEQKYGNNSLSYIRRI